jgi:23S rRNA U2552 (ribose-2'-O)-methylase RlmE/FtsJ/DNA-directed RNA polymerase subunit E'/Rpb7
MSTSILEFPNEMIVNQISNGFVTIFPHELTKELYKTIETKLKKQVEDTCNQSGYIKKGSVSIINRKSGQITGSHFSGNVKFNVQYRYQVIVPLNNIELTCQVKKVNPFGIIAEKPPFLIYLFKDQHKIDTKLYSIFKQVSVDDFINLSILKSEIMSNQIKAIGKLSEKLKYRPVDYLDISSIGTKEEIYINDIWIPNFTFNSIKAINILPEDVIENLELLNKTKSELDKPRIKFLWTRFVSELINDYELVITHVNYINTINKFLKREQNESKTSSINSIKFKELKQDDYKYPIRQYDFIPYNNISRAYYKMWEILSQLKLLTTPNYVNNSKMKFLCLAEGPGGILKCLFDKRRILQNDVISDEYNYISLIGKSYPSFDTFTKTVKKPLDKNKKLDTFNPSFNNLNEDEIINKNNANLLNSDVFTRLVEFFGDQENRVDFITADGAIGAEHNNQEISNFIIFLNEIIIALSCLKKYGTFIIKIYSISIRPMFELIYLLQNSFEQVIFFKPNTSKRTNSETYVVCNYFKDNISSDKLSKFYKNIKEINHKFENIENYSDDLKFIQSIGFEMPDEFIDELVKQVNKEYLLQNEFMNLGIEFIKNILTGNNVDTLFKPIDKIITEINKRDHKTTLNEEKELNYILINLFEPYVDFIKTSFNKQTLFKKQWIEDNDLINYSSF